MTDEELKEHFAEVEHRRQVLARSQLRLLGALNTRVLLREIDRLYAAIREHRDQRGDDKCWMDDEKLYKALPEGFAPPERDTTVELELCAKFIACRRNPGTQYVSPQREIERLTEALNYAKQVIGELADMSYGGEYLEMIEQIIKGP